jgi:nicotinamidase-related amidase
VGTQRDLFTADGKACIRNHRRVLANIRRIMAWARKEHIRVISTVRVFEDDGIHHAHTYCLAGTDGVRKIRYTHLPRSLTFPSDGYTDFPRDLFERYDQVIQEIRSEDPFEEPRADRILSEVKATDFLVIGAPIETSVKYLVLGLLMRRRNVIVLADAVGSFEKHAAEIAMRQMLAKGARLIDSKSFVGNSHLRKVGACSCDRCQGRLLKVGADSETSD